MVDKMYKTFCYFSDKFLEYELGKQTKIFFKATRKNIN